MKIYLDVLWYICGLMIVVGCVIGVVVVILVWKFFYWLFDNGDSGVEKKFEFVLEFENSEVKV